MKNKFFLIFMYGFIAMLSIIGLIFLGKTTLIFTSVALITFYFISKNEKMKKFVFWLFIASFLIRLVSIIVIDFPQVFDFELLLNAAQKLIVGDMSFNEWQHLKVWSYQTGFVIYEALVLKLFSSVFVLKLLNIIYSSLLVVFVYLFSKKLTNEKSARYVSLIYMVLPFPLFLNTVLTNQHLATLLMCFSVLFLLKDNHKIRNYIIAGVFLSFSNIIRPEGIVIITTLLIYELCKLKKNEIFNVLKRVGAFLLVYLSIGAIASNLVIYAGVNETGLKNNDSLWKFVLGFNHETCGHYSQDDTKFLMNKEESLKVIKERVFVSPLKLGKLFVCKIDNFWLQANLENEDTKFKDKSFDIFNKEIQFKEAEDFVININITLHILILGLSFIGIIVYRKDKKLEKGMFFIISLVVCFGVFLLIEIQPRYIYFIYIFLFAISSYGINYVFNLIEEYKNKKKLRKNIKL